MAPDSMLPVPVRAQQRWALLAVCLAALALPLSFSAGAVAVPALARSAAASPTALAWVTNAFMLTFGSLLLAAGGLADRYGRRRLFLLGTAGDGVLEGLVRARVTAETVGPHAGPRALAERAAGHQDLAAGVEHVARERQVQGGVLGVNRGFQGRSGGLVLIVQEHHALRAGVLAHEAASRSCVRFQAMVTAGSDTQ